MSKELTPIEALKDLISFIGSGEIADTHELCEYVAKRKDIIENALKRLEEHDKLFKKYKIDDNWLEACLYVIKNNFPMSTKTKINKLKAFEIIKKKRVDVCWIIEMKNKTLKDYNGTHVYELTQEEYDLLKEELLCD